jgi:ribosome recycling factor
VIEETLLEAEEKMDKAVEVAKEDFASIRTGRANPGLYNKVLVDYYGSPTPLQQLASFAIPDLTQERRKEYVKIVKTKGEDAKISIRNIRRKAKETLDKLVKDGEAGEDEGNRAEKELDALTKSHVDGIDELLKRKEAELLEV